MWLQALVALAVCASLFTGSGINGVGADGSAGGPDITTLNLDRDGADVFVTDTARQAQGRDIAARVSEGGPDITTLILNRDGADVFETDSGRVARGGDVTGRVCGNGPQGRLAGVAMTFIDGFNGQDFSAWRDVLADDFTAIYAPTGPAPLDTKTAELVNQSFIVGSPDIAFAVDRVLISASCDVVAIYWTASGTNTGPTITPSGNPVSPTGLPWTVSGVYTAEIHDGKIVREWTHWDQLTALVQLGLVTLP
jgi:hypothetical protein